MLKSALRPDLAVALDGGVQQIVELRKQEVADSRQQRVLKHRRGLKGVRVGTQHEVQQHQHESLWQHGRAQPGALRSCGGSWQLSAAAACVMAPSSTGHVYVADVSIIHAGACRCDGANFLHMWTTPGHKPGPNPNRQLAGHDWALSHRWP